MLLFLYWTRSTCSQIAKIHFWYSLARMNSGKNGISSSKQTKNLRSIKMRTPRSTEYSTNQSRVQLSENSWIRRFGSASLTQLKILQLSRKKTMTTICGYRQLPTPFMHQIRNMSEESQSWVCAVLEDEKMGSQAATARQSFKLIVRSIVGLRV